jgi:hypothetical protein
VLKFSCIEVSSQLAGASAPLKYYLQVRCLRAVSGHVQVAAATGDPRGTKACEARPEATSARGVGTQAAAAAAKGDACMESRVGTRAAAARGDACMEATVGTQAAAGPARGDACIAATDEKGFKECTEAQSGSEASTIKVANGERDSDAPSRSDGSVTTCSHLPQSDGDATARSHRPQGNDITTCGHREVWRVVAGHTRIRLLPPGGPVKSEEASGAPGPNTASASSERCAVEEHRDRLFKVAQEAVLAEWKGGASSVLICALSCSVPLAGLGFKLHLCTVALIIRHTQLQIARRCTALRASCGDVLT